MKSLVLIGLCAIVCLGADAPPPSPAPSKPKCTKQINGEFWPMEANYDPQAMRRLTQNGELEMCAVGRWKYHWEAVSINVKNFSQAKKK